MICKKCAVAADLVTIAREQKLNGVMTLPLLASSEDTSHIGTVEVVRSLAHVYHGLCDDRCDCQHYVVLS